MAQPLTSDGAVDFILEAKCGDCGLQSDLFVSLCRQAGIPARVIRGPIALADLEHLRQRAPTGPLEPGPADPQTGLPASFFEAGEFSGHAWAEVYMSGWGWIPLEPQDVESPLGRVPSGYVPFSRCNPSNEGMSEDAWLALMNVIWMNYFPKLERSGAGADSTAAPSAGKGQKAPSKKR